MYKLLLCWRYLRTRYLAMVCIVSVMLGVATLIVVNSVMSGFSTKLRERLHGLLSDPEFGPQTAGRFRYVLVDEYQDTNYVQERVLAMLASATGNLCVVGDEDQSLYRFRGATVRNILEFPRRMPGCVVVKLTTNYRSHRRRWSRPVSRGI